MQARDVVLSGNQGDVSGGNFRRCYQGLPQVVFQRIYDNKGK